MFAESDAVAVFAALECCDEAEKAKKALDSIELLKGCEAHSTVILSQVDADVYRKIGMNLTCEPRYQTKKLYHK